MRLTILGSGIFSPDTPHGSAGYVVQAGDTTIKLDFGRGNLVNMARADVDWKALDAVLISHVHPDHIGDLMQYLQAYTLCRADGAINKDVVFYGPKGFERYFSAFREVVITNWQHPPIVQEIEEGTVDIGPAHIRVLPMHHVIDNAGYRIEHEGKVLCYTGDTGYTDKLVELAQGADVLLTECYNTNATPSEHHLHPADIARVGNATNVGTIILTHMPTDESARTKRVEEVQAEFDGTVIAAEDTMTIDV